MRSPRAVFLTLIALSGLVGCADGEAFVDRNYMTLSVRKQKLPGYNGQVIVCFDSAAPTAKRDALAAEACEVYGLKAMLVEEQRWQCRATVPHMATYGCFDPTMRLADGSYVNPFSSSQVELWRKQRKGGEAAQ